MNTLISQDRRRTKVAHLRYLTQDYMEKRGKSRKFPRDCHACTISKLLNIIGYLERSNDKCQVFYENL